MATHRNCGGEIVEDWSISYLYSAEDSGSDEDIEVPAYRCRKCGEEVFDAMIVWDREE